MLKIIDTFILNANPANKNSFPAPKGDRDIRETVPRPFRTKVLRTRTLYKCFLKSAFEWWSIRPQQIQKLSLSTTCISQRLSYACNRSSRKNTRLQLCNWGKLLEESDTNHNRRHLLPPYYWGSSAIITWAFSLHREPKSFQLFILAIFN